jgi:hypothetical protein
VSSIDTRVFTDARPAANFIEHLGSRSGSLSLLQRRSYSQRGSAGVPGTSGANHSRSGGSISLLRVAATPSAGVRECLARIWRESLPERESISPLRVAATPSAGVPGIDLAWTTPGAGVDLTTTRRRYCQRGSARHRSGVTTLGAGVDLTTTRRSYSQRGSAWHGLA